MKAKDLEWSTFAVPMDILRIIFNDILVFMVFTQPQWV